MRPDNADFRARNTAENKKPHFVIELAFDEALTDFLYLTSHDNSEAPPAAISAGEVIYNVVRSPSGLSQRIDPARAVATIGSFGFEVLDADSAVTEYIRDKLAAGDGLRNKQVRLYLGFDGLAWSDYQVMLTYILSDNPSYMNGVYKFNSSDIQRQERKNIFAPQVRNLTKSVTAAQTHIPVLTSDLTEFPVVAHDASYTVDPSTSIGYARIEDEIFSHEGLYTHGTDGPSFQNCGRGALNSKAVEHVFDSSADSDRTLEITEHVFLEGPAPKIIYALETGDLYNQFDASSPPVQLTLPAHWTLEIDTTYVRLADFTGIGADLFDTTSLTGRHVRLDGPKEVDGKRFIEKELLLWLGCFQPVYSDGALGLKRLSPILSDSSYQEYLDSSSVANYQELRHGYTEVINQLQIEWNHDFLKDSFSKTSLLIDSDSVTKHLEAKLKKIELLAVHTGAHTDADLASYFDTIRDRYSGPPLLIDIQVKPSMNHLETGDTVRLDLDQIRDFNEPGETTLDRVFEVQSVQTNWLTGDVKLNLFGSSQKAGTLTKTTLSSVLADGFYTAAGTELSTVLTIVGDAVTESGSLTGASTMASGIFYYDGNLTINAGVTVNISDNVQLRIKGSLQINGAIDGAGNGATGGLGGTVFTETGTVTNSGFFFSLDTSEGDGTVEFLGDTRAQSGLHAFLAGPNYELTPGPALNLANGNNAVSYMTLVNNSTSIDGLPTNLMGTSGGGGAPVITIRSLAFGALATVRGAGGPGGSGGAGLMIISRGLAFGASGSIDTSGDDGVGGFPWSGGNPFTLFAGSGSGGAPGGLAIFLDGNHTPPELTDEHVALYGNIRRFGEEVKSAIRTRAGGIYTSGRYGITGRDLGSSAYTLQFVPEDETPSEQVSPQPPDVSSFTAVNDGLYAKLTWDNVVNTDTATYEIREGTIWGSGTNPVFTDANIHYAFMPGPDTYDYMIKAISDDGKESQTEGTAQVVGVPTVGILAEVLTTDGYNNNTFYWRTTWESLEPFSTVGTVALNFGNSLTLVGRAGGTTTAARRVINPHIAYTNWDSDIRFKTTAILSSASALGVGTIVLQTGTNTHNAMGFHLKWNSGTSKVDIYGFHYHTVTNTVLVKSVNSGTLVELEAYFELGSQITFTVDATTQTTSSDLPTGSDTTFEQVFSASMPTDATATLTLEVGEYALLKE